MLHFRGRGVYNGIMARRKSIIRLPFIKAKINSKTIFNIFGFIIIAASFILLISFVNMFAPGESGGVLLKRINEKLSANSAPFLFSSLYHASFFRPLLQFEKTEVHQAQYHDRPAFHIPVADRLFMSGAVGRRVFDVLTLNISAIGTVFSSSSFSS
jgi:S-DNA-T family DNA segregation ATPase FtsK/SpoIIIE